MKSDSPPEATIRDYLLGKLEDQPEIEKSLSERVLFDRDLSDIVDRMEEEIIEQYLDGTLSSAEKEAFDEYFLRPAERKLQLQFMRRLREGWNGRARTVAKSGVDTCITLRSGLCTAPAFSPCMIVHMHSEYVESTSVPGYLEWMHEFILPRYSGAPGILSVAVLRRQLVHYAEVMTVSSWGSKESLDAFMLHDPHKSLPESAIPRLSYKEAVVFEVVLSWFSGNETTSSS